MKRTNWYILLVKQGFEKQIKEQLNKKLKELLIEEALVPDELPGYVFVRSTQTPQQYSYLEIDGVLKFLGKEREPKKFCDKEITRLNMTIPKKKIKVVFHIGDQVIVKHGDLTDIQGEIVQLGKRVVKIKPMFFEKIVRTRVQDIEFI